MRKGLIVGLLASVMLLSFASLVFAAEVPLPDKGLPGDVITLPDINKAGVFALFDKAANIIFTALLILASVFVLLAAFQFITGGGNAEALEQARGKLIWAVVGVGVAFLAKGLPAIIGGILKP